MKPVCYTKVNGFMPEIIDRPIIDEFNRRKILQLYWCMGRPNIGREFDVCGQLVNL